MIFKLKYANMEKATRKSEERGYNMDFLKLCEERYSLRKFDGRRLSDSDINRILEAARLAPTAKNLQPQKIYVINTDDSVEKLKKCTKCDYGTKTSFLICYDKNVSWKRDTDGKDSGDIDASIVTTQMMLEAASAGAGSTWVMWFDAGAVSREFSLPDNIIPVAILVCGYPAADAEPSPRHADRKQITETVTFI